MIVVLIGYMGCGKTTIGASLAEEWKVRFIDTDNAVQEKAGKPIESIFTENGEEYFRQLEQEIITTALARESFLVLSTGGGAPCYLDTMNNLLSTCFVVYLECDAETLFKRAQHSSNKRPLQRKTIAELQEHLNERQECYLRAHCKVDGNKDIQEVVESIQNAFKLHSK